MSRLILVGLARSLSGSKGTQKAAKASIRISRH